MSKIVLHLRDGSRRSELLCIHRWFEPLCRLQDAGIERKPEELVELSDSETPNRLFGFHHICGHEQQDGAAEDKHDAQRANDLCGTVSNFSGIAVQLTSCFTLSSILTPFIILHIFGGDMASMTMPPIM